ncbi:MAG: peptidase S41, partial [Bacteroidota bacterium]
ENDLERLTKNAEKEQYYERIEQQIQGLKTTIDLSKKNDLDTFKAQIKKILEQEIATRYTLEKGAIETSFDSDRDIIKAIEVLGNEEEYNTLLSDV